MGEMITGLFLGMDWLVIVLLAIGLIMLVIEVFVPGFGVFGIMGTASTVAGVLARVLGKGLDAYTIVVYVAMLVFLVVIVLFIAFLASFVFAKRNKRQNQLVYYPKNFQGGNLFTTQESSALVGKFGVALTDLNPSGKIKIDDGVYDAVCSTEYIKANAAIQAVFVDGNKIGV